MSRLRISVLGIGAVLASLTALATTAVQYPAAPPSKRPTRV